MLKTFFKYVIPSILSMIIFYSYTLVDGIYVSYFVGQNALASINVSTPYVTTIFSVSVLFAIGSSTVISIYRGQNKKEDMNKVFTMNFIVISCIALCISITSFLFSKSIVTILKANADVFSYSNTYIKTLSLFSYFYIVSYCMEVLLKTDGFPQKSIIGVSIGAITNIVLDPVFMGYFHMGILGSALATGLSQFMTFLYFLYHFTLSKQTHFQFVKGNYPWDEYKRILPLGCADCISEISPGIMITFFNMRINDLLSTNGLVIFSVLMYVYNMILMVMVGTSQGMQPLLSLSYGKKDEQSMKKIHFYARCLVTVASIVLFFIVEIFAQSICGSFIHENPILLNQCVFSLRLFSLVFLVMGQVVLTSGYLVAVEKPRKAFVLSLLRGIGLVLLSLWICSSLFGSTGIWLSCFVSECFCFVISLFFLGY
ncbi:MATE family efflux transporter [Floccifex sp.]|uniref:MATE family efflux transporter n=1 Tax=Floccifex sp. TaxID=2815810 RepID=UPI003F11D42F